MMLSSPKEGVSGVAGTILAGLVVRPNKGDLALVSKMDRFKENKRKM